jgi:hypothetical protein
MRLTDVEFFRVACTERSQGPAPFFRAGAFAPGAGALDYQECDYRGAVRLLSSIYGLSLSMQGTSGGSEASGPARMRVTG